MRRPRRPITSHGWLIEPLAGVSNERPGQIRPGGERPRRGQAPDESSAIRCPSWLGSPTRVLDFSEVALTAEQRRRRAVIAARSRHNPDDPQTEARRDLRALTLEEYVRRMVDDWPPLSDEQRTRIAALLRPPAQADSGGEVA